MSIPQFFQDAFNAVAGPATPTTTTRSPGASPNPQPIASAPASQPNIVYQFNQNSSPYPVDQYGSGSQVNYPGETLNQALISAGYGAQQAYQIEENDLQTPGYGWQPGQYATITDPNQDNLLAGYNSNSGNQPFAVQNPPPLAVPGGSAYTPNNVAPASNANTTNVSAEVPAGYGSTQPNPNHPILNAIHNALARFGSGSRNVTATPRAVNISDNSY